MARKEQLRKQREGTIINVSSKKQESVCAIALNNVILRLTKKFKIKLTFQSRWMLTDIIKKLREIYKDVEFHCYFESSFMRPDGGILFIESINGDLFPILITEVKNQGTNVDRIKEGKPEQARGNAIERLGKNVIGFRTALLHETIFPFVCFGDGCDFNPRSTILDRVVTISMFGKLNKTRVHNEGSGHQFNRGSFYFRENPWTAEEMENIMYDIAEKSIYYYFSKYGEENFKKIF